VKFRTGGKRLSFKPASPQGLIRCNSGADSKVWMGEGNYFKAFFRPLGVMCLAYLCPEDCFRALFVLKREIHFSQDGGQLRGENIYYMQMALETAGKALGRTSPNPMVGAVVVRDGQVVGSGYHARAGTPHAEVHALREAGAKACGATLYVTLEPCCHHGRTGPCTEAVIKAGITKVVVAMEDPNPKVAGKGVKILQNAGITVETGVLEEQSRRLNEVFIKYISTRLPFVVMKTAMSLDGKIATASGESQWITGPASRAMVHRLRDRYDAILVGVGTVLADNPSLTTRLSEGGGKDPVRVVLDSRAMTPVDAQIITQSSHSPTIIVTTSDAPRVKLQQLSDAGAQIMQLSADDNGICLHELLCKLAEREITSLLVEGGTRVNGTFINSNLVDKVCWFIAPKIIGGHAAPGPVGGIGITALADAMKLSDISLQRYGEDIGIEGYVAKRGE